MSLLELSRISFNNQQSLDCTVMVSARIPPFCFCLQRFERPHWGYKYFQEMFVVSRGSGRLCTTSLQMWALWVLLSAAGTTHFHADLWVQVSATNLPAVPPAGIERIFGSTISSLVWSMKRNDDRREPTGLWGQTHCDYALRNLQ